MVSGGQRSALVHVADAGWLEKRLWWLAVVVAPFAVYGLTAFTLQRHYLGGDAGAYWAAWHRSGLYGPPPGARDAYLYSPAFADVIRPLALLPRPAFIAVWIGAEAVVYAWLIKPLGPRWAPLALLGCLFELYWGNVHAWFALVAVIGFGLPAAWTLPLLTKVVAAQGVLWFVVRRQWRSVMVVLGTSALIAAFSCVIDPGAWENWFAFVRANPMPVPTAVRLTAACVITVVAARTDKRWALPVSLALAAPMFDAFKSLSILAAIPRLVVHARASRVCATSRPAPAATVS